MNQMNKMYIELFNDFVISYHNVNLCMRDYLSKQAISLLQVLVLNYGKTVSKEGLMELMWSNNENPDSALKFNIFRLRKLLKEIPELSELVLIHTDKNGYRFDPDIPWSCDYYEFEVLNKKLEKKSEYNTEDYCDMQKLLDIYKGKLYHMNTSWWFVQMEQYFTNAYLQYITPLCEYHLEKENYDEVYRIAHKAATLEPAVENNYYYQILSHIKQEEYGVAYECYQHAVDRLEHEFEIKPSKKMKKLYHEIVNENDHKYNPEGVMDHYRSKDFDEGAFYCTNGVFDYIYEMRQRSAKRDKSNLYLYVFDLDNSNDEYLDDSMKKLKSCIVKALRGSDIFTKMNRSQFLALLSCPTEEIAYSIAMRVQASYRNKIDYKNNHLNYHLCQVND